MEGKENVLENKSYHFALNVVKLYKELLKDSGYIKKEDFQNLFEQSDELSRTFFSILKKTRINK